MNGPDAPLPRGNQDPESGGVEQSARARSLACFSGLDARLRQLRGLYVQLHKVMWWPWAAEIEDDVVVDLRSRHTDRRFERLETRARDKDREIGDLLFVSN